MFKQFAAVGICLCLTGLVLGGCGVRGSLQAPEATQSTAQAGGSATSAEGGEAAENSAAQPKPHRGFVLDGLLR
ncbi:MAG: hypothetical protein AAFV45_01800 [Pseudomonadota bacterium]